MKNTLLFLIVTLFCVPLSGQRYLTDQFSELDSIIGGVYGNATDYQSVDQDLLYDLYEPADDLVTDRPLLIYIHGGGFNTGSRSYPSVQEICRRMAHKGYVVANIDYRLDPNFDLYNSTEDRRAMTDAMHDAKQAIRYFKANAATFGIDTSLVFIGGESAGAATAMMATYVDKQSEMATYPMANPNDPVGSDTNNEVSSNVKGVLCLCGILLDTLAMETPDDPSILWTHGTEDSFIPISLAFSIVLRATNLGIPIQAKAYQGATHCPWFFGNPNSGAYLDSTVVDITSFLFPMVSEVIISVEEPQSLIPLALYPNPFSSYIEIDLTGNKLATASVKVYTDKGRLVFNQGILDHKVKYTLDLAHLSPGVYFLEIDNGSSSRVEKIVKVE